MQKSKVQKLQQKIKLFFTEKQLKDNGVPKEEIPYLLNYKIFPLELLVKASWNYKTDNSEKSLKLQNNIKRIGQVENIQVRGLNTGYYEVVNGNHRLDNLLELGKKFVVAFDHGKISTAEAQRIAIETNETKFEADTMKLAELIVEIQQDYDLADLEETMPYSEGELKHFAELLNFDLDDLVDNNLTQEIKNESDCFQLTVMIDKQHQEKFNEYISVNSKEPLVNVLVEFVVDE